MQQRVAAITGGAGGIGLAVAHRLAGQGVAVALHDRDAGRLEAARASLAAAGSDTCATAGDVTSEQDVRRFVEEIADRWGRLDYLITAAGILRGAFQRVDDVDVEDFRRVLEVNVLGTFLCCKHAVPLLANTGGVIVCIASHAGVLGPSSSLAYGASKSAVFGFARTLEHDLAPRGIRVVTVTPGSIDTEMKRENLRDRARAEGVEPEVVYSRTSLGTAEGVGELICFALSPQADHLRGMLVTR